jgi:hypothetical protein
VTAGYSGTPLPKKLGIKDGHRVALVGAPEGFDRTLGMLPPGVRVGSGLRGGGRGAGWDVIVCFLTKRSELDRRFAALARALEPDGGLWIAWPKGTSKVATDVNENTVREVALSSGLVDNKVCAIDETWSGLRLVYRVEDRPRVGATARRRR